MNYLKRMYNVGGPTPTPTKEKNTNRVLGGLRGQGVDHYSVLGEDGVERFVPTQKYVHSLEKKIHEQDQRLNTLEKKIRSVNNDQKSTAATLNTFRRN